MYGQNSIVGLPSAGVGFGTAGGAFYMGWNYLAAVAIMLLFIGAGSMMRDHVRRNGLRP